MGFREILTPRLTLAIGPVDPAAATILIRT
jgi:hypothetical protein